MRIKYKEAEIPKLTSGESGDLGFVFYDKYQYLVYYYSFLEKSRVLVHKMGFMYLIMNITN